ncbi:hypothetical protein [Dactylosporangium darangshiense]|uniref:Lipoprotein n=1 Tax=Dactylosporangium darangshiense TaxID=579108 RepID=A0ABP8DV12_9ACTN
MRISRLFAGLSAVALLGACGDAPSPAPAPTASSGASASRRAAAGDLDPAGVFMQVAQCFRVHGHPDYPDPVQNADGSWAFPVAAARVPVPAECADVVSRSRRLSPSGTAGAPAADLARERAFAGCMRANGVPDWPDPGPDGTFAVPERLADPRNENLWRAAADGACRQYQPDGGPDIVAKTAR